MRRLLLLFAAVALLGASCGGGGSSSGTTTRISGPPLSKQAYRAKLQSIAAEIGKRLGETTPSEKLTKSDVDEVVKAAHELADRLREVNPPAEIADLHAQLIAAMDDLGNEFPDIAKKINSAKDASAGVSAFLGAHAVQELLRLQNEFTAKGYKLNLNP